MTIPRLVLTGLATMGLVATVSVPSFAQSCGHYIVLGCFGDQGSALRKMNDLGGPGIGGAGVGGSRGTQVVNTNNYPNFRNGYYCVADGPYSSREDAESIAWREAVRDAYVKNAC